MKNNFSAQSNDVHGASNVVDLGQTIVIGQGRIGQSQSTIVREEPLSKGESVLVTFDISCEGESYQRCAGIALKSSLDFEILTDRGLELTLSFNVTYDDGNLPCVFSLSALDVLAQLSNSLQKTSIKQERPLVKKPLFFTTMVIQSAQG